MADLATVRRYWLVPLLLVGLPLAGDTVVSAFLPGAHWVQVPFHAVVESLGAFAALSLATVLLILRRFGRIQRDHAWVASGLVAMGLLDGLHAMTSPGQGFVWLHSVATFAGGGLFAAAWLPERFSDERAGYIAVGASFVGALAVGFPVVFWPNSVPIMVDSFGFTPLAITINLVGGLAFVAAAARFALVRAGDDGWDRPLLFAHCILFGVAGLLFESSQLWDMTWWTWHLLRLLAYGIVLAYFFLLFNLAHAELRSANVDLERRVEERTVELVRSNTELDDFAYIASHDLKEPLRGIHTYASFLLEDNASTLDPESLRRLETLGRLAVRMEQLVDDLLRFSRVGRVDLAVEETDIGVLVADVVDSLSVSLEQRGMEVRIPRPLPVVRCDAVRVKEVFRNLLVNALKYNDRPDPWVEVTFDEASRAFSVRDNGIGIREKHLGSIFTIFKRLHAREKYGGGTGAGLTIVKKIVERHGGTITVQSTFGEGAAFTFTLDPGAVS